MFTGIIKAVGIIESVRQLDGDARLAVRAPDLPWAEQAVGDSVSVSGVCLTIAQGLPEGFAADVSRETLGVTTLGELAAGSAVNLELALAAGERLGGHIVSGHVDCVGVVTRVEPDGRSRRIAIELAPEYRRYLAKKGSVCVDGVSLTINAVSGSAFEANIIPHTADSTIIGDYRPGRRVNIEVDVIARYVESLLGESAAGITEEFRRAHGHA